MREHFERLSESYDSTEEAEEVMANHAAHRALLGVLAGSGDEETGGSPGPGWIAGDDADCQREVLDLLLQEAPDCLDFDDVAVALAGDSEDQDERNTLREAVQALVAAGLARRNAGALAPSRSARQMAELGFLDRLMDPFAAEVAERVGRRVRRRRRAIDMTQEELAFRAGIHRTQITLIEKGRRMPYLHTLIKIAGGLGISTCQLFEGITWAPDGQVGSFGVDLTEDPGDG